MKTLDININIKAKYVDINMHSQDMNVLISIHTTLEALVAREAPLC